MWWWELEAHPIDLLVQDGIAVEGNGAVVRGPDSALLVRESVSLSLDVVYPAEAGVALHGLEVGDWLQRVRVHGTWMAETLDVSTVISAESILKTDPSEFDSVHGPKIPGPGDILRVSRLRGDPGVAVVIAADAVAVEAWRAETRVVVSRWTRAKLEQVRTGLGNLDVTIALGEKRATDGDVVLTLGVTHVTSSCVAILEQAPAELIELHALVTPR